MTKAQTLTVQLMHAEARIKELEAAAAASTPAPTARAVAESHAEAWLPRMDTMRFSRPPVVIFDDRDAAFEFQKAEGVQPSLGHRYAVSQYFRTPSGVAACAVY